MRGKGGCAFIFGSGYDADGAKRSFWGADACSAKHAFVCKIEIVFEKLPQKYTWVAAESECRRRHGHLAHMLHVGDDNEVYAACQDERCWIGLNDRVCADAHM